MKKQSEKGPDIVDLMTRVQAQLAALERKVDVLVSRSSVRPSEASPSSQLCSSGVVHAHPDAPVSTGPRDPHRGRPMYQAVCADCKKDCEIPFKPSGDRPVYCKECFSRRKSNRVMNAGVVHAPAPAVVPAAAAVAKLPAKAKKKPAAAKKPVGKKKPALKKKK